MYKFGIMVPAVGQYDAFMRHFATNGVNYLYSVDEYTTDSEVHADATDEFIAQAAMPLARSVAAKEGMGVDEEADFVAEVNAEGGSRLGWIVTIRQYDFYPEDEVLDGFLV